jgi:hypothetical protein
LVKSFFSPGASDWVTAWSDSRKLQPEGEGTMKGLSKTLPDAAATAVHKGDVYCYLCTHTVEAEIYSAGKISRVKPGQKCPRCSAPLDSGYVLRMSQAA